MIAARARQKPRSYPISDTALKAKESTKIEAREKEEQEGEPETNREIEVEKTKRLGTAQEASPVADLRGTRMNKPFPQQDWRVSPHCFEWVRVSFGIDVTSEGPILFVGGERTLMPQVQDSSPFPRKR